nr:MAG TPA_asm: hypothetical protein [Caudoviricetes sp.]
MQREQSVQPRPDCTLPRPLKPSCSLAARARTVAASTQPCNATTAKTLARLGSTAAAKTLA